MFETTSGKYHQFSITKLIICPSPAPTASGISTASGHCCISSRASALTEAEGRKGREGHPEPRHFFGGSPRSNRRTLRFFLVGKLVRNHSNLGDFPGRSVKKNQVKVGVHQQKAKFTKKFMVNSATKTGS